MFSSNQLRFCSQENESYYPEVFLKECKYIKNKVSAHILLNNWWLRKSDDSDEYDEEWIKAMRLIFLEKTNLKMIFI